MGEQRKQVRKSTNDYFMVYDRETGRLIGRLLDLSIDGAMIISDVPTPEGALYQCKMHMPRMIGRRRYVFFDATRRWGRKNRRLGWYETGYQLSNVSKEDQDLINHLTDEWSTKSQPSPIAIDTDGQ